ncbi:MAG: energy-coupling factor ABC transporter ATP-binding protein [Candidatus Brocadiaceae bacterium]|nr:energy-coupling factor ABC transporter ATP-binding protein [Candidatus Brocadiaceae bacterium]
MEFCDVSFGYSLEEKILEKINFNVRKKEIVTILGLSGNGKSTLLMLANRLLETSGGVICYNGQNIRHISPLVLRKEIGYLSQIPYLIEGTVKDNLLLPFYQRKIPEDIEEHWNRILLAVGLRQSYLFRSSHELSVGEKQRVALARALMNQPQLLLLDEPNSALDEEHTRILVSSLKRIVQEESLSLLIVTHQIGFAHDVGDRFLVLKNGGMEEIKDLKYAFIRERE